MSSTVKFTTLNDDPYGSYQAYILEIPPYTFLLDCGWDSKFNMTYFNSIAAYADKISAILLSYPSISHIGILTLYDWVASLKQNSEFNLFDLEDIDRVMEKVQKIKYSQLITINTLKGVNCEQFQISKNDNTAYGDIEIPLEKQVTIQALCSGHMLGGSYWKISRMSDEDIIYAVDFNNKKERHLNGANFNAFINTNVSNISSSNLSSATNIGTKPLLFITSGVNAGYVPEKRRTRDEKFLSSSYETLRNGGDVLVCVDTGGRMLELVNLLNSAWCGSNLSINNNANQDDGRDTNITNQYRFNFEPYALVLLSNVGNSVLQTAVMNVEWMNDRFTVDHTSSSILGNGTIEGTNGASLPTVSAFSYDNFNICNSLEALDSIPQNKLILVPSFDMEIGFSRNLFYSFVEDPKNLVILTNRSGDRNSLAGKLFRIVEGRNKEERGIGRSEESIDLDVKLRVLLEGKELEAYNQRKLDAEAEEARKKQEEIRRKQQLREDEEQEEERNVLRMGKTEACGDDEIENSEDFLSVDNIFKQNLPKSIKMELVDEEMNGTIDDKSKETINKTLDYSSLEMEVDVTKVEDVDDDDDYSSLIFPLGERNSEHEMMSYLPLKSYDQPWDDYGEIINAEEIITLDPYRKAFASKEGALENDDDDENDTHSVDDEMNDELGGSNKKQRLAGMKLTKESLFPWTAAPTKCISYFEGRVDGDSLEKIISQMSPKNLIIVNGYDQAVHKLMTTCRETIKIEGLVDNVKVGKSVEIVGDSKGKVVRMSKDLISRTNMIRIMNGQEWSWIEGILESKSGKDDEYITNDINNLINEKENIEKDIEMEECIEEEKSSPIIDTESQLILKPCTVTNSKPHPVLYLNSPKLIDIKARFTAEGYNAVLYLNILHINGIATIQKDDTGSVKIEGKYCMEYFKIRDLLYNMFAII
ncbi:Cleavage and polyadenylation specificity factor subunit 2 [Strongyloides ratti]|uniref:Cleavage and polyadenylation specificity factor subunit 2 n=1 Tax=Strongyloides ratti TaxID=34506 RepID=A0A090MUU0_STRRB|nr:Cleavage and polyadenylation specificity factor subunit 2 [Strongyloides ratti]CEF62433.1 Cleavage and polyadenylation specificity factor subunit 2 [Strongyloides ratti]